MCLGALLAAQGLEQIVIVDNGNDAAGEALLDACAARDERVRLLRGQGNIGFGAACNLASRNAVGDVLAFINPDAIIAPDAVMRLAEVLRSRAMSAIVGGDLRDQEGQPERGGRRDRLTFWRAFVAFSGLTKLGFRDHNRHLDPFPSAPERVGAVSGALLLIRREDFRALGGFDEGYFLHVEDIDLCRRAEDLGWGVWFVPGPHGVHLRSSSEVDPRIIARHKAESMARYFRKFARSPLDRILSSASIAILLALTPKGKSA